MVLGYLLTFVLARALPVEELGYYFLIVTITGLLALFSALGLDYGLIRYVAIYSGQSDAVAVRKTWRTGVIIAVPAGFVSAFALYFLAPTLSAHMFEGSQIAVSGLRILSISIPILIAARLFNATTQGLHKMQYHVYSRDFGEQLSKLVLSVLVLALGASLLGVLWANLLSVVIALLLSLVFALMVLPKTDMVAGNEPGQAGILLRYSLPIAFSSIVSSMMFKINTLLLGVLGTSTEVAYYGVADKVAVFGGKINFAFATVFAPIISDLWSRKMVKELSGLFRTIVRWIFTLSLPIFIFLILFADGVMSIFGSNFVAGSTALIFLALGQLVANSTGAMALMVLMSGHSTMELINLLLALAVNTILCFLLIPTWGLVGAALASMVAFTIVNLVRVAEVWIILRMNAYDPSFFKPIFAGLAVAAIALIAKTWFIPDPGIAEVAIFAPVFTLMYTLLIIVMGLSEGDRTVLRLAKARLTRVHAKQ